MPTLEMRKLRPQEFHGSWQLEAGLALKFSTPVFKSNALFTKNPASLCSDWRPECLWSSPLCIVTGRLGSRA